MTRSCWKTELQLTFLILFSQTIYQHQVYSVRHLANMMYFYQDKSMQHHIYHQDITKNIVSHEFSFSTILTTNKIAFFFYNDILTCNNFEFNQHATVHSIILDCATLL